MVLLLIDNSIFDYDKVNDFFYLENNIIPINSNIGIIKIPYHENSKHIFRNLFNYTSINIDTISKKNDKPIRYSNSASKKYYNPKLTTGKIIDYEYIPININNYFKLPKSVMIKRLLIWTNNTINSLNGFVKIKSDFLSNNFDKLYLITKNYRKTAYFNEYELIPKYNYNFSIDKTYFLDFSNIFTIKNNKFLIELQV